MNLVKMPTKKECEDLIGHPISEEVYQATIDRMEGRIPMINPEDEYLGPANIHPKSLRDRIGDLTERQEKIYKDCRENGSTVAEALEEAENG